MGGNKQWGKLSRDSGILAKGGAGAKHTSFLRFFWGTNFWVGHDAKIFFRVVCFFVDNNTLCRELNIFANLQDLYGSTYI